MKDEQKFELTARYLDAYIRELLDGKEEAFIAITDISPEMLPDTYLRSGMGYTLTRVDRDNYSDAVRYRNDGAIKRLVLLCEDSIRRIDSLKDFIEYPIISGDREILWRILRSLFSVRKENRDLEECVSLLIRSVPMEIGDLLEYLDECISRRDGQCFFSMDKINDKLNRFDVWRSKGTSLTKAKLRRQLNYSKPDIVRQRLERALEDKAMPASLRQKIVEAMGKDRLDKLYGNTDFSEVEKYFRYRKPVRRQEKNQEQEEHLYEYSYDKCLKEENQKIQVVEDEIEEEYREPGEAGAQGDGPFDRAREIFVADERELKRCVEQIDELSALVDEYSVLEEKKTKWKKYIKELRSEFNAAVSRDDYRSITPVMLSRYCENQQKFISIYFEIMSWLLSDEVMNHLCDGTELVESLQMLFCKEDKGRVDMPFYHPVAGLYFLRLKKLYEEACRETEDLSQLSDIPSFMVNQEKLWFPIRFLQKEHKLYQLDYTSIREPGRITFYAEESRRANSTVNFRLFNSVIEEYILNNPYLGELYISIVDLNDIQGLPLLLRRLQRLVNDNKCFLSRIVISVVSLKEREIKQELARLYDMGMDDPSIYFRFIKRRYTREGQGQELDLTELLKDSDLLFFADTDVIYNSNKMVRFTEEPNEVRRRLERFSLDEQITFSLEGKNYIELLWDTLQRIQNGGGAVLSRWSNQELNMRKLREINGKVQSDEHFAAVIISANNRLLRHFYRESHYQIRKSRVSGNESMILILSQKNRKQELLEEGSNEAAFSLSMLLDELAGEENFCRQLLETENLQNIIFWVSYENGRLHYHCRIELKEREDIKEKEYPDDEKEKYRQFAEELISYAFSDKGSLALRFREMLVNELYGRVESYPLALALYQLSDNTAEPEVSVEIEEAGKQPPYKSTDVMELLDLSEFFNELIEVDGSSVTRFLEYYQREMLSHVLSVAEKENLLTERMRLNMKTIYERIKNQDGKGR